MMIVREFMMSFSGVKKNKAHNVALSSKFAGVDFLQVYPLDDFFSYSPPSIIFSEIITCTAKYKKKIISKKILSSDFCEASIFLRI